LNSLKRHDNEKEWPRASALLRLFTWYRREISNARTVLIVTTTVGNEVVQCGVLAGRSDCAGTLIGGLTLLANGGTVLTKGPIALVK
jgi:hypothetical protein